MTEAMEILNALPAEMKERFCKAAEIVRKHSKVHIMSHYDADGITSAAIIRETLRREGIDTEYSIFTTLSKDQIPVVLNTEAECVVMTDIGTSYLRELAEKDWDIVILDHHKINIDYPVPERGGFCFNSPLLYGIDGSKNACGAAMAFLFSVAMNEKNADLVPLSMAGMFGDKQNLGGFESIDKLIVDMAVEECYVKVFRNLAFPSGTTFCQAMMSYYEPYFKGMTGEIDKVYRFVKSCELQITDAPINVPQEKIDGFADAVAQRMRRDGVTEEVISQTFGDKFYSVKYKMDVSELSAILDGCGRAAHYKEAFEACDSLDFTEAMLESQEYSEKVIDAIEPAYRNLHILNNIQYFVMDQNGMTGNIASALVRYLADHEKPVIGLTVTDSKTVDISSRGTTYQVGKGLNLSSAMRDVCAELGGQGGGHIIAAGGSIPKGTEERFVRLLDEYVGKQFADGKQ